MRINCTGILLSLAAGLAAAAPANAHHGWSGQSDTQSQVTGTVTKPVSLSGPHATLEIVSNGQVWNITLAPPARTQSAGLTPSTLKVGRYRHPRRQSQHGSEAIRNEDRAGHFGRQELRRLS